MSLRVKKFLIIFAGVALLMNGAMASSVAYAENNNTTAAAEQTTNSSNTTGQEEPKAGYYGAEQNALDMISCGSAWDLLTVSCIVPQLAYYVLYLPAMGLLSITGEMFDFILSLSIDREFIDQPFVNQLWEIVRDFSNMVFIFVLLYTGIQTMFGLGGAWQKKIATIVILAIIINFSMFFSKIIIDAGNTLAVGVYSGMGVVKTGSTTNQPHKRGGSATADERDVSAAFVGAFNPMSFADLAAQNNKGSAVIIFLVAAVVSGYVAWILIKASLMFVGRIIAFWFYMIISPFALISMVLPKGNIFNTWLYGLINQAMVAPVFLFFVYLIMFAVQSGKGENGILSDFGKATGSGGLFDNVLVPIVLTGMIIYALNYALKVATGMADEFGKIGAQAANYGIGMAVSPVGSLALGGASGMMRAVIGGKASQLLKSDKLSEMQGKENPWYARLAGRTAQKGLERVQSSSFDVRGTKTFGWMKGKAKSELGVDVDFGRAGGKGGYKKEHEEWLKQAQKDAEKLNMSKTAEKAVEEKHNVSGFEEALKAAQRAEKAAGSMEEATKNLKDAQSASAGSVTGGRVENAQKGIKDARSNAARFAGDIIAKKITDLEAKKALTNDLAERVLIAREIDQINKDAESAGEMMKLAEEELSNANRVHLQSAEARALAAAEGAVESIQETANRVKEAERQLNEVKEKVKGEINSINEGRREQHGKDVSWKSIYTYREDVKKIKEGIGKDKKEQEKLAKSLKKIMEEEGVLKKEGKKDESGDEKK